MPVAGSSDSEEDTEWTNRNLTTSKTMHKIMKKTIISVLRLKQSWSSVFSISAKHFYGGQAVIEGVMMRGPDKVGIAVRKNDGSIAVKVDSILPFSKKYPVFGLPVLRGAVSLFESLILGIDALSYSANEAGEETQKISKAEMGITILVAMAFAVGLFIVLPTVLSALIRKGFSGENPASVIGLNLIEGAIRIIVLLGYILSISFIKDIQRVLAYHGAEHKVINAYEAGVPLDVSEARRFSTLHPRCGTSFLLFTALVSIILFSFFGWPGVIRRILIRISLLPIVAGLSYELIRAASRRRSMLLSAASWPGLMLQRMTTREPDDSMLEVAVKALEGVLQ